jgi:hypothetical protein
MRWVVVLGLAACGSERTWGTYEQHRRLVPPTATHETDVVPGDHVVLAFLHTSTPAGCASERMRQTEVFVEIAAPAEHVDLATVPVVYQYGGQRLTFRGVDCRGELSVTPAYLATIDVTCRDPASGEQRSFSDDVELRSR